MTRNDFEWFWWVSWISPLIWMKLIGFLSFFQWIFRAFNDLQLLIIRFNDFQWIPNYFLCNSLIFVNCNEFQWFSAKPTFLPWGIRLSQPGLGLDWTERPQGMKSRRDGTPEVTTSRYLGVQQGMKEWGFLGHRPPSGNVRKVWRLGETAFLR